MAFFSEDSKQKLATCDPALQSLFSEVIKHFDCKIICGHRGEKEQNAAFSAGKSKVKYPKSKHNSSPSVAADVMPYPIDWKDLNRIRYFAGFVMGVAAQMGISLRWGGDWDMDTDLSDNKFNDLVHFEVIKK